MQFPIDFQQSFDNSSSLPTDSSIQSPARLLKLLAEPLFVSNFHNSLSPRLTVNNLSIDEVWKDHSIKE